MLKNKWVILMPNKPKTQCKHIGCPELVLVGEGYCAKHKKQREKQRGNSTQRGYDARWRRYRIMFLHEHPLCVECLKKDRITASTVVDHIVPHKGNYNLFWDETNHQALCKECHDYKTATEDGGFGH
jgi:5-methylcytosine-specific restriction enzyme A